MLLRNFTTFCITNEMKCVHDKKLWCVYLLFNGLKHSSSNQSYLFYNVSITDCNFDAVKELHMFTNLCGYRIHVFVHPISMGYCPHWPAQSRLRCWNKKSSLFLRKRSQNLFFLLRETPVFTGGTS